MLSLIVAMTPERVIGWQGKMPWHGRVSADLRWFKENTLHKPVIMGRATWDSIGRALPQRHNIVVTRQTSLVLAGATVTHSVEQALALVAHEPEVMIIGGGELYREALPLAQRLYLTTIHTHTHGDTYFPAINPQEWVSQFSLYCSPLNEQSLACSFTILDRLS
nr:type 3 dihydrofolate reductase [Thiofilum flexile]